MYVKLWCQSGNFLENFDTIRAYAAANSTENIHWMVICQTCSGRNHDETHVRTQDVPQEKLCGTRMVISLCFRKALVGSPWSNAKVQFVNV